jgi:hypothetical protein
MKKPADWRALDALLLFSIGECQCMSSTVNSSTSDARSVGLLNVTVTWQRTQLGKASSAARRILNPETVVITSDDAAKIRPIS